MARSQSPKGSAEGARAATADSCQSLKHEHPARIAINDADVAS